jgi:hypothetical protein
VSGSLTATIALYAVLLGAWATLGALRGGQRGKRSLTGGLIVLEAALVVQAALGAIAMLTGPRLAEPATHAGYLAASVLVLPVALAAGAGHGGAWRAAIVAIGCLAALVVSLRLVATAHALG